MDFTKLEPSVIMKNFKLIYHFLTVPICKDPSIVGKIFALLTDSLLHGNLQIFSACEMNHYERIATELHFKKLALLSRIIIACFNPQGFKRIETRPKRVKETKIDQNLSVPSKFQKEDKSRILEHLSPAVLEAIVNHLMHALQDCMLMTTMPKQALKGVKDFTFIRGSSRSAYNQETIENSVQCFI